MFTFNCELCSVIYLSSREAEKTAKPLKTLRRFIITEQLHICISVCVLVNNNIMIANFITYLYHNCFLIRIYLSLTITYGLDRASIVIPKEIDV